MYIGEENFDRIYTNNPWVRNKPNGQLGYVLLPGAPDDVRREFEETEALFEAEANGTLEIINEDEEQLTIDGNP